MAKSRFTKPVQILVPLPDGSHSALEMYFESGRMRIRLPADKKTPGEVVGLVVMAEIESALAELGIRHEALKRNTDSLDMTDSISAWFLSA